MQKNLLLVSILFFVAVLSLFFIRSTVSNHGDVATAILALSGLQATSSPQTDNSATTTVNIIDVLQQLQDQEQRLASEVSDLRFQVEGARLKGVFVRVLKRGDSGDDVTMLQTLLSNLSGATATSTTNYYGNLTEQAVKDFQTSVGLKRTGIFDLEARGALIALIQNQVTTGTATTDSPLADLSSVTDPQQSVQNLQDQISQLTAKVSDDEITITDLQNQVMNLESTLSGVQSNVSTLSSLPPPTPITQSLAISSIQVGSLTKTSATITWTTNNPATSEVDYSPNASMPVSQTLIAKSSTMTTSHSTVLPSLVLGTVYYYHIISKDGSSTIANSSNLTFTTLH